ncbi:DNA replication/repair protein RecF [candidate division KSB1 bacterium]
MFLKKLVIRNFRNYPDTTLSFENQGNLLYGGNGQGKTNLIESIYYLSVFRSFRRGASAELVRWGEDWFKLSGLFDTDSSHERCIDVQWDSAGSKKVSYENDRVNSLSELLGSFPMVVLSPESSVISQGQPAERRRFLDICFSVTDREYLAHLTSYKRVLKQRNNLLLTGTGNTPGGDVFEPWDEELIKHGSYILDFRSKEVELLSGLCRERYSFISGGSEELTVKYLPGIRNGSDAAASFRRDLAENMAEERRRKYTLAGPHRDEVKFYINGRDARNYGSQGQHKTILLAIKAAEAEYIRAKMNLQPVLLLDDLFAMLETKRVMAFLNILKSSGQFFITANTNIDSKTLLTQSGFSKEDFSQFLVKGGSVQQQ